MSTHNICFNGEKQKNIFWLKKVPYLELYMLGPVDSGEY